MTEWKFPKNWIFSLGPKTLIFKITKFFSNASLSYRSFSIQNSFQFFNSFLFKTLLNLCTIWQFSVVISVILCLLARSDGLPSFKLYWVFRVFFPGFFLGVFPSLTISTCTCSSLVLTIYFFVGFAWQSFYWCFSFFCFNVV